MREEKDRMRSKAKNGRGCGRGRGQKRTETVSGMRSRKSKDTEIFELTSASDDDPATIPAQVLDSDSETETASRPLRWRQLPQRYKPDSENDENDCVLCSIC